MNTKIILIGTLIVVIGLVAYIGYQDGSRKAAEITTFEECTAAGYPIMESYPEVCRTPDGKSFVRFVAN